MYNMNTEKSEKQLISLILDASKKSKFLSEKYLPKTKKLFESVFYQEPITPSITLDDCRNNKLFYFKEVRGKVLQLKKETNPESLKIINESLAIKNASDSIGTFLKDISLVIDELQGLNDFDKIEKLNPIVKQTINFAKKDIVVNGFNIQQILDPNNIINKELFNMFGADIQNNLKLLVFNKSDKELYFIFERKDTKEKTIIYYSLNTNTLDYLQNKDFYSEYGTNKNDFFNEFWKNEKNYLKVIGNYMNNNLFELYRNNKLFDIVFTDNLYKDYAYIKREQEIKNQRIIK